MEHTIMQSDFENFDDIWGQQGSPVLVEEKLLVLLPQAALLDNQSIYLQMLSQLALAQACQQKFDAAHATLDRAQSLLTGDYQLARVRILCERGRTFQQAGDIAQARYYFEQSYSLSVQHGFDKQTINAAHMIAIVAVMPAEKIAWNRKALDLAMSSDDALSQSWKGPLLNNLGANYLEIEDYENALHMFERALTEFEKDPALHGNSRFARFRVAQVLRMLKKYDQALLILEPQLQEYDQLAASEQFGMPREIFIVMRGWLYEELAIIYGACDAIAQAQKYAQLALHDLANNGMFLATDSTAQDRIAFLQKMIEKSKF